MAVPTILPSSIFGADGQLAPSHKITLGCIGVGGMGTENLKSFLGQPDCRLVAVCDVSESKRQNAKERVDTQYGDQSCAMIADWRELIARKDIDAVMIATQDHWHSLIAVAAAKAGKDMYCEKPMGGFPRGRPSHSRRRTQAPARLPGWHLAAFGARFPLYLRVGP